MGTLTRGKQLLEFYKKNVKPHFERREKFIEKKPLLLTSELRREFYNIEKDIENAMKAYQSFDHSLFDYD